MPTYHHAYVISDLHLGGLWPAPEKKEDVGFRMMTNPHVLAKFIRALADKPTEPSTTELIINGDFIDFLAEQHEVESRWIPFVENAAEAVRCFNDVAEREGDREVFEALQRFVKRGHCLTLILGNHDVEFSLPAVRRAFERRIGMGFRQTYRFLYDGEAYEVGDALVEHGNRYDPFNIVTHDNLRRLRSLQSRRQFEYQNGLFVPPVGSSMVANVMNPLKADYPFIDLLKPESEPLFALILAFEPGYRDKLKRLAHMVRSLPKAARHRLAEAAFPSFAGDIASQRTDAGVFLGEMDSRSTAAQVSENEEDLRAVLARCIDAEVIDQLLLDEDIDRTIITDRDISLVPRLKSWLGLAKLLANRKSSSIEKRLHSVQETLEAIDEDNSFERGYEAGKRYRDAAEGLSKNYRTIVFGHTHHAKQLTLHSGETYLNSGTWANLMRFPKNLFDPDQSQALVALTAFFGDLRENRLRQYLEFCPTYVRLDVDIDGRTYGELCEYDPSDQTL